MDLKLQKGKPDNFDGRLAREIRCYDFLESLSIDYEMVDHEHADTMEACAEIEKTLGAPICKNLFLCNRQQTDFYLLMIPGDKVFKTKDLSSQIGTSRLSFASAEHMIAILDTEPGSLSVLSLINDKERAVRLLVDRDLLSLDFIGCHPCVNTSSLKLRSVDIFDKILKELNREMTTVDLPVYLDQVQ